MFLIVIGALIIKVWLPQIEEAKPVAMKDEAPVALEDKALSDKAKVDGPICENELRRTADLIRFFANRIQMGEEIESVVADMRHQEKRISAVCQD